MLNGRHGRYEAETLNQENSGTTFWRPLRTTFRRVSLFCLNYLNFIEYHAPHPVFFLLYFLDLQLPLPQPPRVIFYFNSAWRSKFQSLWSELFAPNYLPFTSPSPRPPPDSADTDNRADRDLANKRQSRCHTFFQRNTGIIGTP